MTEEQWRPVVGYEGDYEVSDLGRIWSRPRKGTRGGLRKLVTAQAGGYLVIALGHEDRRYVHSLVLEAFVGPRPEGAEIRHLDGDPANARLDNLAYGTSGENKQDQVRHGTHARARRTHCGQGHPLSEENIYTPPARPNVRYCRACRKGWSGASRIKAQRAGTYRKRTHS